MKRLRSPKYLGALLGSAAALALLVGTADHSARATTAGSPTSVSAFGCIVGSGGHVTRPAGSAIIIRQAFAEQTLGILNAFLTAQMTIASVNDAPMFDVSGNWGAPAQVDLGLPDLAWESVIEIPTGVTLANPGDQMRFTFSLALSGKVPEVFNPAIGGAAGQPAFNGPGLSFGGTCTVTAT
jgi:hypothetical protein